MVAEGVILGGSAVGAMVAIGNGVLALAGSMLAAGLGGPAVSIVADEYGVLAAGAGMLQPAKTTLKARIKEIWDIFGLNMV